MMPDPIIEDVRSARQKIFEGCGEDLDALLERFQEQEELDQEQVVTDLPRPTRGDSGGFKRLQQKLTRRGGRP